ncbi:MAG: hypothetical protein ACJ75F_00450 [Flavisolibacter sp.]
MKFLIVLLFSCIIICCSQPGKENSAQTSKPMEGTWKLLTGTVIENGDTTITDYTHDVSFIKIINATHFSFLQHDLKKGKDSAAVFVAGGGRYSFNNNNYTEHLEYCSAREWEGNDFSFSVSFNGDTLIQQGIEKVEKAGVNRINTEKYTRVKSN